MNLFNNNINIHPEIDIKLPWVEKYRPKKVDDIILDGLIKQKIVSMINNKYIPNMILTGEPSTGKTSTILYISKLLYDDKYSDYVLELNASDDRGLSIINNTIYPFCKKKISLTSNYPTNKLIILDEADSITQKAQNLLSNIITEFKSHTSIIFICNDCDQIIESIQSKCIIIKYPKISHINLYNKIESICVNENIKYDKKSIDALLFVSDYDIRQAINNLECIYYTFKKLQENDIYKLIDKPKPYYISNILNSCYNSNYKEMINIVKSINDKGYTSIDILSIFMKYIFEQNIESFLSFKLNEKNKIAIYNIISKSYIHISNGIDTLLQLCGCMSNIYIYIQNNIVIL